MKNINVDLSKLEDGGLQERFEHELAKVADNVFDLNTDFTKKRKIVITIDVATTEYRDELIFSSVVKSTLTPRDQIPSRIGIAKDADGKVLAAEIKSGQKGQMFFDATDETLKDDKGVPVDEIEKQQNIINFKEQVGGNKQ